MKTDREIEEELFREYLEGNYDIIMGFPEYYERNKHRKKEKENDGEKT
jgi:hypothetical protein